MTTEQTQSTISMITTFVQLSVFFYIYPISPATFKKIIYASQCRFSRNRHQLPQQFTSHHEFLLVYIYVIDLQLLFS